MIRKKLQLFDRCHIIGNKAYEDSSAVYHSISVIVVAFVVVVVSVCSRCSAVGLEVFEEPHEMPLSLSLPPPFTDPAKSMAGSLCGY